MERKERAEAVSRLYSPKVEKLAICYGWTSPFMFTRFMDSGLNLQRPANSRWFRGIGWCPARRHIDFCQKAIKWGASHILILGTDQTFPEDMIPRLIERVEEDGCEVISALVPTRGYIERMGMKPFQPVAWRFKPFSGKNIPKGKIREYRGFDLDGDMMEIINPADGDLQRIDCIGSGVLMFPVETLLALQKPWFSETFVVEDYRREASMDTRFVWNLKLQGGAQVWCDTTIKVGHLNIFEIDETYQDRFGDWDEIGYGTCKSSISHS